MRARSIGTDRTRAVAEAPRSRPLMRRILDRWGSIELDVTLAIGPVLLWLVAGMRDSARLETLVHLAILGLLLIVPRAGILALIPLLPFETGGLFPPHGPIVAHAIAIALSITFRAARGGITVPAIARPAVWFAVALLLATIFQATLGLRDSEGGLPGSVLNDLDQIVIIVMVFVGSTVFLRPAGVVPAMVSYMVSFVTVSAVGILHFARPSVLRRLDLYWMVSPDATRFRASGVIPNANFLGLFIAIGLAWLIVIIAWYVWRGRLIPIFVGLVAGPIGTITLMLTLSRAAILAAGVGVLAATARASLRSAFALLVAGILVAAIAYPVFLNLRLDQTFGSAGEAGQQAQNESDNLRAKQAVAAVKAFLDAPILGHGFGTFGVLSPQYTGQTVLTSAHNTYLKFAAEQGVVGLGLFVAFLGAIVAALWRSPVGPWSAGLAVSGVIAIFSLTGDSMAGAQSVVSGFAILGAMLVAADAGRDPLDPVVIDDLGLSPEDG
jgi:O-antigen ligase